MATLGSNNNDKPLVVICGGGPGGLLAAILLNNAGVKSTVLERSTEIDAWSTRSYSIVLGERAYVSLQRAGSDVLDRMREVGNERRFVFFFNGETGDVKAIPKKAPGLGFSRSLLVESLEEIAVGLPNVTIRRGAGVSKVACSSGLGVDVHLEDDSCISGTHVIGADGKWSKVRQSLPSLEAQGELITCGSFGVAMVAPKVPEGWRTDGTYVVKPASNDNTFYIIASPLPGEGMSISMVVYDEALEKYPWLAPPADKDADSGISGMHTWKDEYSAKPAREMSDMELSNHLEALFQEEFPAFLAAVGKDTLNSARINGRASWLRMSPVEEGKEVMYATDDGRVALIGDAAHCMTASMGEGCNTALESAMKLVDCIVAGVKENDETSCSVDTMNKAFVEYGLSRPKDTQLVQEMSAAANTLKKK